MKKNTVIKIVLCSFLAATMVISAIGCNSDNNSQSTSNYVDLNTQTPNCFKSGNFTYPDDLELLDRIQCINDKIYLSGHISATNAECMATVYDTVTGEKVDIDVSSLDIAYFNNGFLSQDTVYLEYTDQYDMIHICTISHSTGAMINDARLGSGVSANAFFNDSDGNVCIISDTSSATAMQSMIVKYDKDTLKEKEKININEKMNIPDNIEIVFVLPQSDGSFYAFGLDMNDTGEDKVSIYKISSSFELVYNIKNGCGDMEGGFESAFINQNGNLCVMTCEYPYKKDISYVNEFDPATGEVIGRYEPEFKSDGVLSFISMEGFDFVFVRDQKLFGYDLVNDEEKLIFDYVGKLGEAYVDCHPMYSSGKNILVATSNYNTGCNQSLYEADQDGNILNTVFFPENALSSTMKVNKEGLISFICDNSTDENGFSSYQICTMDIQGNIESRIELNPQASEYNSIRPMEFVFQSNGDICVGYQIYEENDGGGSEKSMIILFDSDGKEKLRIDDDSMGYMLGLLSTSDGDYVHFQKKYAGLQLCKIDYENKKICQPVDVGYLFYNAYPGDKINDFYFNNNDGIYGYSIKNKKVTEILNWIDSDIELSINNICVISPDKIIADGDNTETGEQSAYLLSRVDDQTLKRIQSKKVITLSGTGLAYDGTRDAVIKFNRQSDKYRIRINDYDQLNCYKDDEYLSGKELINADLVSGNMPDILVGNYQIDMSSYISKGLLTDLNPLIDKDKKISRDDYFENIFDIYSSEGKLYQLVTNFYIDTLVGKESDFGDKSGCTFDEFFELAENNNIFYMRGRDELLNLFVLNNLSEYVDFNKKTCDFNNDNFIKILEMIKENGMTEEQLDNETFYRNGVVDEDLYNEYLDRFKNKKCYLDMKSISSFKTLAQIQQFELHDAASFIGLPSSSEGGSSLLCADHTIAISEKSNVKDGAWEFVREFLFEDYQRSLNPYQDHTFPVMKSVFKDMADKSQSKDGIGTGDYMFNETKLNPLDSKSIERFTSLVENSSKAAVYDSRINKIINEQAQVYFGDGQSSKETAKIIQSKVSLYFKETK